MTKAIDENLANWAVQRGQRESMAESFDSERPIDHFAYFDRRRNARGAAESLEAQGFEVTLKRRGLKTCLVAVRSDSLGELDVDRFLRTVISIVEEFDGDYDGFGAPVIQL